MGGISAMLSLKSFSIAVLLLMLSFNVFASGKSSYAVYTSQDQVSRIKVIDIPGATLSSRMTDPKLVLE